MQSRSHSTAQRMRGFTLIEVMIVVAIVAILAAVAYPSYVESVRKSRRAEARAQLLEAVQYMQRFYSQNDRFDQDIASVATALPTSLNQSPRSGAAAYTIGFVSGTLTPRSFQLEAVPTGTMAGDRCGTLSITGLGVRAVTNANAGVTVDDCWR